ncbi:MAG: AsmA family protein [Candidatus Omnitrophota bacterium]
MKFLKIGLIVLLIFIALLVAGGWIFFSTFDANRYVPQLTQAVRVATGRDLAIGNARLSFSFTDGVLLQLEKVALSDDPRFSDAYFAKAARVVLSLDLGAFLREKSLVISNASVLDPEVMLIRAKDGRVNAAAIGGGPSSGPSTVSVEARGREVAAKAALPLFVIKKFQVRGARIRYMDRSFEPAINISLEKGSFDVKDFSLVAPFTFDLSAALLAGEPNLLIAGRAAVDAVTSSVNVRDVTISLALDNVSAALLADALPMLKPVAVKQMRGKAAVELRKARFGARGIEELDAGLTVDMRDTVLTGINLLAVGLNSISLFPDLLNIVMPDLPEGTQADIRRGITAVDHLGIVGSVMGGSVTVQKMELDARDLSVSAQGGFGFQLQSMAPGDLDLKAAFFIAPKLTDVLVGKVPEFSGLKQEDGRVYIPFTLSGPMLKPKVLPDLDYLAKRLLIGQGGREIQRVLKDPAVGKAVGELFNSIFKGK